jgi:kynurenine formamidase
MRVIDLEQPRFAGMPVHPSHRPGYFYALHRRHTDNPTGSRRTSASGVLTMMEHTGTHIDALSHQAADACLYGGTPAREVESAAGFATHGVEEIPPIVRRAVIADLPRALGVERLEARYEFTVRDLESALGATTLQAGNVLLVRTGFAQLWDDQEAYLEAAGAAKEASLWAAEKGVYAVGADNMAWDVPGVVDPETGVQLFAHFYLLAKEGIYIIENLNLEELAASGAKECQFICLPLKLKGATGSPVRPIAIL